MFGLFACQPACLLACLPACLLACLRLLACLLACVLACLLVRLMCCLVSLFLVCTGLPLKFQCFLQARQHQHLLSFLNMRRCDYIVYFRKLIIAMLRLNTQCRTSNACFGRLRVFSMRTCLFLVVTHGLFSRAVVQMKLLPMDTICWNAFRKKGCNSGCKVKLAKAGDS